MKFIKKQPHLRIRGRQCPAKKQKWSFILKIFVPTALMQKNLLDTENIIFTEIQVEHDPSAIDKIKEESG